MKMNMKMSFYYNHPYHLVTMSPWPLLTSLSMMIFMIGSIYMFNYKTFMLLFIGLLSIILCSFQWWRDIIRESTFQGLHTKKILISLKLGMFLFIISELLFFISFFWSYFHSALSPNIELGNLWPPKNIKQFNPYKIPLLNTIILLSSGISITFCHYSILNNNYKKSLISLLITISLGLIFMIIQMFEYSNSLFCMNDSIYGSMFFLTTGFHGSHVMIGLIFLMTVLFRLLNMHLSMNHHYSFEASSWYWHFVDIIWIFVFSIIYWWNY
uniref:Cytochrome c oxidase subunit 3 n=1 Tax=Oberthuerella sharkeyi TaxID=2943459 RepID=A0A9E8G7K1_9HYME|nr:cytochrome c oxidase subunit 3 [Oberthuerella sharkeyi]